MCVAVFLCNKLEFTRSYLVLKSTTVVDIVTNNNNKIQTIVLGKKKNGMQYGWL